MTVIIKDRQKGIEYHAALIAYSEAVVAALRAGVDLKDINASTLPINVNSPTLINQYARSIKRLYGAEPAIDPCRNCHGCISECFYYGKKKGATTA